MAAVKVSRSEWCEMADVARCGQPQQHNLQDDTAHCESMSQNKQLANGPGKLRRS